MSRRFGRAFVSLILIFMVLLSAFPLESAPQSLHTATSGDQSTPIGQATKLTIGSWPDGANQRVQISVPDGHSIKSLDLDIQPSTLENSIATTLTEAGDFDINAIYDGMNVNTSTLGLLPRGISWDFETPNHGWTLGSAWSVGYDTTLGQATGVYAGNNSLYTYNGNYPNSMAQNYATSPSFDCSGCSGTWSLTYWKLLGIESASFDHAYVQVTNPSGSWVTIWSHTGGSTSPTTWSQMTHDISSYISGNANFQVRFILGTTDGSVVYTGWNVDDVIVEPIGGQSGGEGNWTSDLFGPSLLGRGEAVLHGLLHMDVMVYAGSIFEYQIMDALTGTPVPGFERIDKPYLDLGMIDVTQHPYLRLKIHLKEATGGGAPEIRSISMNGIISKSFDSDPTAEGWNLQGGSWSSGVITGTGVVMSNNYEVRSGFSAIQAKNDAYGPGQLQYSVDNGVTWHDIGDDERAQLSQPAFQVQFRMNTTGSAYSWNGFEAELIRTSVPQGIRFDIGLDGAPEWSLDRPAIGMFGMQNSMVTGEIWTSRTIAPASTARLEVALPTRGVDAFSFMVASPTGIIANPFLAMAVNGQDILSRNLANINDLRAITLTSSELTSLNNALLQAQNTHGVVSFPMATVEIRIGSSLSTSTLLFGGIFAPYDPSVALELSALSPLVMGLNHELASVVAISGQRTLSLPLRMDGTGSVYLTVQDFTTQASVKAITLELTNVSTTLVPGNDWIEAKSTFDFSPLSVSDALTYARQSNWEVELQLVGEHQQSRIRCPFTSLPVTSLTISSCSASGTALLWFDEGVSGSVSTVGSGPFLEVRHHFKFPDGWDDEAYATLSVHLISNTGPMLPVTEILGLGYDQAVENDLEVLSWAVVSSDGIRSDADYPYLQSGKVVNIEVILGFEGTPEGTPRAGQALIRFMVDRSEYATTTVLQNGVARFAWNVPMGRPSIELGIEVVPLRAQSVISDIAMSTTFMFDNVAPTLIDSSVEKFDSRDIAPQQRLTFMVSDQPHLPTHAEAIVWKSWIDDENDNGVFDYGEQHSISLVRPMNLSSSMGEYALLVDTSSASQGDYFLGWLKVADSAGHLMAGAGTASDPMFHVQLNNNGAPSLGVTSYGWASGEQTPWLHPGEENQIRVPVWEQNGIFDLEEIQLSLSSTTVQSATITWNADTNLCTSSHPYIEVDSCGLVPLDETDLFSRNGEFFVNFLIEWGYDADTSVVRVPRIFMKDHSGQSNIFLLDQLEWRFSGELVIDPDSIVIYLHEEAVDAMGYWVQPRTTFALAGDVLWYRTGNSVQQSIGLELKLGNSTLEVVSTNGSFSGTMLSPLMDGTYGLFGNLKNAPNGAVYRGEESAFVWFIVDNQAPRVTAVDSPVFSTVLNEDTWKDLEFEIRLSENARLDESTLKLHWSVNEAGRGPVSYVLDNGTVPLEVLGERLNGESIPVRGTLDLDAIMLPGFRTNAVELRIWVTGADEAGQRIDSVFNDIDAPLRVWALEQRVPFYTLSDIELKPVEDIRVKDVVDVVALIENHGLADGEANLVLELVEATGARTRLDARAVSIQAGEQILYQHTWIPIRDGAQWLELSIINGPNTNSMTVLVGEERADGVLGTISEVNPTLLAVVGILIISLIALLIFGLRRDVSPHAVSPHVRSHKEIVAIPAQHAAGPYGAQTNDTSPGDNPYR